MCGLVGVITKHRNGFNNVNMDMFDTLLFLDQMRGPDSTGIFSVSNIGNVTIAKQTGDSNSFLPNPEWKKIRGDAYSNGWALVGHNRKATRGAITDENAHPFWVDDKLVLVHNGSAYGDHKHLKDVDVDSEAIAHTLAEEPNVETAIQKVNAAYALIWYDIQNKKLNILRNMARPLAWVETNDAFYIASEIDMLVYAMIRNKVKSIKDGGPEEFEPYHLDTFQLNNDKSHTLSTTKIDCAYRPAKPASATNFTKPSANSSDGPEVTTTTDVTLSDASYGDDYATLVLDLEQEAIEEARAALDKAKAPAVKVELDPLKDAPQWAQQHTYGEWVKAKQKFEKQRVRVECKDTLLDDTAGPNKVYMTGQTEDGYYCIFPIHRATFDAITDPTGPYAERKKVDFNVEIDIIGWRGIGAQATPFENTLGLITLTGRDPKIYSQSLH